MPSLRIACALTLVMSVAPVVRADAQPQPNSNERGWLAAGIRQAETALQGTR